MVEKLLAILRSSECTGSITPILMNVVRGLLCSNPRVKDVLCFALFTAATLSERIREKSLEVTLSPDGTELVSDACVLSAKPDLKEAVDAIVLRNRCLQLFYSLLYAGSKIHVNYCEDVINVVGFDWILLFIQGHLHQTTVVSIWI